MSDPRWLQVKALFQATLDRPPAERAAFLTAAAAGDEALRREIESLLDSDRSALGITDRLPGRDMSPLTASPSEVFPSGDPTGTEPTYPADAQVGPYRIIALLGAGGMGEVFRARDSKLNRDVALKVLPGAFEFHPERLARFRREAQALAALNHPHIAAIYGLEESNGRQALVLELVDGVTLANRIADGPLSVIEALTIARQIADALQTAHEKGIVHRDLKPANIKVTPDGVVKVLDFGLAKTAACDVQLTDLEGLPAPAGETRVGVVLGTAAYMSPEQARGLEVDARTDIWTFGCVLFEMLTGHRAFAADAASGSTAKILEGEPDWNRLPKKTPPRVQQLLRKCLQKDPDRRPQTIAEARTIVEQLLAPRAALSRTWAAIAAAAIVATSVGTYWWLAFLERPAGASAASIKTVAVLPIRSADPNDDQSLGLKLTDALTQRLSRLRGIVVRPTRAVQGYEGKPLDPLAAGREQQVDAVLDGSFQRAGQRLRLSIRLLQVSDGRPLWTNTFDEPGADLFFLQDAAAQTALALLPHLTGVERQLVTRPDTKNTEAQRLYTDARYYWNKRNVDGLRKSVGLLEQAVALDPEYARAYAALADAYIALRDYAVLPASEAFPRARDAAQNALAIDGSLAEAHTALAIVKASYDWDRAGAEQAFGQAIDENPNYATARQSYAEFLTGQGRHQEALDQIRQAQQLDPLSLIVQAIEALNLNYARDYDGAIAQCRRVLSRDPSFGEVYAYLGFSYEQKGMFREALDAYQTYSTLMGYNTPAAAAIRSSPVSNATDYWKKIVELENLPGGSPTRAAQALAQLGETDKALAFLERAAARRSYGMLYLKVHPNYDPLRSDPRFTDLLRRVGFPP